MIDQSLFVVFAFFLGACVGSFLNVVIYRVPRGMSVGNPKRSFCPSCKKQIPATRNIPLVSWLWLNGRCGDCRARIPARYFGVELATAVLFALIAAQELDGGAPSIPRVLLDLLVVSLCVAITVIDFQLAIIPDPLTIPWLPLVVAGVAFEPLVMRGHVFDPSRHGSGTAHALSLLMAGCAVGVYPALFVDFLRRDRGDESVDADAQGEPESALPTDDEEFSLVAETREFLMPALLPAALGAAVTFFALRDVDLAAHPRVAAAITSAAGVGGGLLVIYLVRLIFSLLFRREAMGLGDAKFLALAGAVLGAEGVALLFGIGSMLGAIAAFAMLLRAMPGPTLLLLVVVGIAIGCLPSVAMATSPTMALGVGLVVSLVCLISFFRKLRASDVELRAMPFGPFLALAAVVLLIAYEPITDFLAARFVAPHG